VRGFFSTSEIREKRCLFDSSQRAQASAEIVVAAIGLKRFASEVNGKGTRGSFDQFSLLAWLFRRRPKRHVNVLEDMTGGNAQNALAGFYEIVALAAGVLTVERVGEGEVGSELFGFDEKAGAIGDP
jgi:hypothetical protein